MRQGSVFIICWKVCAILTLSMLKHTEMGCQKSADPGSPRVKEVQVNQNFNAYLYAQIALATLVLLLLPISFQRIFGVGPSCFHKLDQIRIDEKQATSMDEDKPRRVSEAIDYHRVTTADKFVSRRETALQFRQSVMATLPKTSVFKRSTKIGATTLKP